MPKPAQGSQAALDLSWQQEQLASAHSLVDKLGQQNDFLRNELLKRGVVVEGEEDHSFALGGVPDAPMTSASFTDSAGGTAVNVKREGSDSGGSITPGLRYSLLQQVRDSDTACGELELLLDKLQSQLSSDDLKSVTPSPRASPFAAVAAGSRDEQLRNAKLLCGEVSQNVAKLRVGFSTVTNTLQQTLQQDGDGDSEPLIEEPQPVREAPPAWRDSFDVSQARQSVDLNPRQRPERSPAWRGSFDIAQSRQSVDSNPRQRSSVSFQPITQPAYSARLDHFSPANGGKFNLAQGLEVQDDFASANPLFDEAGEHVAGTHGVALTRASVAAQVLNGIAEEGSAADQEQIKQSLQTMQQQVIADVTCYIVQHADVHPRPVLALPCAVVLSLQP